MINDPAVLDRIVYLFHGDEVSEDPIAEDTIFENTPDYLVIS